jgi:transcription elongation factor Elf1
MKKNQAKMLNKKKEEAVRQDQSKLDAYLTCQMCGREIEPDACVWQEDDEGAMYCYDCNAERESCGCSD